jgi:hypothetical protein
MRTLLGLLQNFPERLLVQLGGSGLRFYERNKIGNFVDPKYTVGAVIAKKFLASVT